MRETARKLEKNRATYILMTMSPENGKLLFKTESYEIRGAAFEVYKQFRNSQKEKVYQRAFADDLERRGLKIEKEKTNSSIL
jgi:hypothetical protein